MISLTVDQRAAGYNQIGIKADIFECPVKFIFFFSWKSFINIMIKHMYSNKKATGLSYDNLNIYNDGWIPEVVNE